MKFCYTYYSHCILALILFQKCYEKIDPTLNADPTNSNNFYLTYTCFSFIITSLRGRLLRYLALLCPYPHCFLSYISTFIILPSSSSPQTLTTTSWQSRCTHITICHTCTIKITTIIFIHFYIICLTTLEP